MKTEIVKVDPKEFGLEESKAVKIADSFAPKISERDGFVKVYENILTKEVNEATCKEARELRLKLVKVRTGIAAVHKTEKAFYLASGKYVDALKNKLTLPVSQMEEKLEEIEKHFENIEKEKIAKLQEERKIELLKYSEIDAVIPDNLGEMDEQVFKNFLTGTKANFEAKKEAEKKAEEERIAKEKAEAEAREKMRIENERLKKEAEAREKAEAERKAKEEEERKKREVEELKIKQAHEEELRKEREAREKAEKEAQAKIEAEKKERERLEREAREKEAKAKAERKAKAEQEEKERQAELNKGDLAKVQDLIKDLETLKEKYSFKSKKNQKMYADTCTLIDKVINHINS
jgi:hypothetical protein